MVQLYVGRKVPPEIKYLNTHEKRDPLGLLNIIIHNLLGNFDEIRREINFLGRRCTQMYIED